jgi:hypothetical protein
MRSILTFGVLALVLLSVSVGYTGQIAPGQSVPKYIPIADGQEMCCCEYVVQDNLDPANRSASRYAWMAVHACWAGYSDPLTIGRQSRPPGRCVSAALCGRQRM